MQTIQKMAGRKINEKVWRQNFCHCFYTKKFFFEKKQKFYKIENKIRQFPSMPVITYIMNYIFIYKNKKNYPNFKIKQTVKIFFG